MSGVLLAGGRSRRMGRDKLPLAVGGRPLLSRAYAVLAACCDEVIPVVRGSASPPGLPDRIQPVRDLRLSEEGLGPLAGLEAGLRHARYGWTLVVAGDMPFLSADLLREMLRRLASGNALAVVPRREGGREPLCAAYRRESVEYAGRLLDEGRRSMRGFVESLPEVEEVGEDDLRRFGDPGLMLMNVNSPEDLARAREAARGG